jgi:hypothetical protein
MEMSQENSQCNYLKQIKCHFFFFSKIREQERRTGPAYSTSSGQGVGISGRGQEVGKGHWIVNIVQIECTHVCK